MTMRALGPVSSMIGTVMVRDLSTMSIGFSKMVSIARMGLTVAGVSSPGRRWSLALVLVISASGVPGISAGSGEAEGFGVGMGIGGSSSGVVALAALGATLLRIRGDGFLAAGSASTTVMAGWSGSKISLGSTLAAARLFLGLPGFLGVVGSSVVVFRRPAVERRGLRVGAGAKSSSLSSAIYVAFPVSTSSSESIMAVRLVAARRDGRVDMVIPRSVGWKIAARKSVERQRDKDGKRIGRVLARSKRDASVL